MRASSCLVDICVVSSIVACLCRGCCVVFVKMQVCVCSYIVVCLL